MNSVLLLGMTAVVFVFAYRYYAKLLAAGVFRPVNKYSTTTPETAPSDQRTTDRAQVLGYHFAALAAPVFVGVAVAAGWGWTPAFLTLVIGTVAVGGVFAYALFWLARGRPGASIAGAAVILSAPARAAFFLLIALLLLAVNGVLALLAARLLAFVPAAPLALALLVPLALVLGRIAAYRWPAIIGAVALALVLIAAGARVPIEFAGELGIQVGEATVAVVDGVSVWLALLFGFLFAAARLPAARLARPLGALAAGLLALSVAVVILGILLAHPNLAAPNFHAGAGAPPTVPFVFAALGAGSLAGVYLLAAARLQAAELDRPEDPQRLGYGGTLLSGGLGVVVLIAAATAFAATPEWTAGYPAWAQGLTQPLALTLAASARLAAAVGIAADYAHTAIIVAWCLLALVSVDAGLRCQQALLKEAAQIFALPWTGTYPRALTGVGLVSALLLYAVGVDDPAGWTALGVGALGAGGLSLMVVTIALLQLQRPAGFVLGAAAALLLAAFGGLACTLTDAVVQGRWGTAALTLGFAAVLGWLLFEGLRKVRRAWPARPA